MPNKERPRFKTEAEEAEWWANNQEFIADQFEQAEAEGKLGRKSGAGFYVYRD